MQIPSVMVSEPLIHGSLVKQNVEGSGHLSACKVGLKLWGFRGSGHSQKTCVVFIIVSSSISS